MHKDSGDREGACQSGGKRKSPTNFGEVDSRERHRQEFVNVPGHILDRRVSFPYSSAVNERIIDRNCAQIKKESTALYAIHVSTDKSELLTRKDLIQCSSVQGVI